jgi:hypothetical protein
VSNFALDVNGCGGGRGGSAEGDLVPILQLPLHVLAQYVGAQMGTVSTEIVQVPCPL